MKAESLHLATTRNATKTTSEKLEWIVTLIERDESGNLCRVEYHPFPADQHDRAVDYFATEGGDTATLNKEGATA